MNNSKYGESLRKKQKPQPQIASEVREVIIGTADAFALPAISASTQPDSTHVSWHLSEADTEASLEDAIVMEKND